MTEYDILTVISPINRRDEGGPDTRVICTCSQVIRNFSEHKYWPVVDITKFMDESAALQLEWWSTLGVLQCICLGVQEKLTASILICSGQCWSDVVKENVSVIFDVCGNSTNHRLGKGRKKLVVFPSQRLLRFAAEPILSRWIWRQYLLPETAKYYRCGWVPNLNENVLKLIVPHLLNNFLILSETRNLSQNAFHISYVS